MIKHDILGTHINTLDLAESMQIIKKTVLNGGVLRIVTANPETIYKAMEDIGLQTIINTADLVVPDGIGVVWAARRLGANIKERVTGIDLSEKIIEEGNRLGWRIFLLGSQPGIAEVAVSNLYKRYPGNTYCCNHGYFTKEEEPEVIDRIRNFAPDVLLVGLGAPLQEYWNMENEGLAKVSIGVGGTIDVISGQVQRAPRWIRESGLEWLYRLGKDPNRLSRQKVLPLFVWKVLKQKRIKE